MGWVVVDCGWVGDDWAILCELPGLVIGVPTIVGGSDLCVVKLGSFGGKARKIEASCK